MASTETVEDAAGEPPKEQAPSPAAAAQLPPAVAALDEEVGTEGDAAHFKGLFNRLRELMRKQMQLRQAVHDAVAGKDCSKLQAALTPAACRMLLPVEAAWAKQELSGLLEAQAKVRRRDEAAEAMLQAWEKGDLEDLVVALDSARKADCDPRDIRRAEQHLAILEKNAEEERTQREAQAVVDKAVNDGDVQQLQAVLGRVAHILPAEVVENARKRIPAMQARSSLRTQIRETKQRWEERRGREDLVALQCLAKSVKHSALPAEEAQELAMYVQREKNWKPGKAGAEPAVSALPRPSPPAVPSPPAAAPAAVAAAPPIAAAPPVAAAPTPEPPAPAAPAAAAPAAVAVAAVERPEVAPGDHWEPPVHWPRPEGPGPAREPETALEKAIFAGSKSQVKKALRELQASGLQAHDILQLQKKAVADFGFVRQG